MSFRDILAAATIVLLWSVNFTANKVAVGQLPPVLVVALRFVLMAVLLAPLLRRPLPAAAFRRVLVLSFTLGVLHFGLFFTGLKGIGAGLSAIVGQLAVPFSAILAAVLFGERTGAFQVIGMAVAFAGVYVIVGEPGLEVDAWHLVLSVAAALAFAAANVQIKRLAPIAPFTLNAWIALLAAPQMFVASWLLEGGQMAAVAAADWRGWGALVFTTVTGGIIAYGLWYSLLGRHPINRVMPLTLLAPGLAVIVAALLLGEPLTAKVLAGAALTLAGVAIIQWRQPRAAASTRAVAETETKGTDG